MTPMTNDPLRVRTTAIGLLSFAAAEEQLLLAAATRLSDQGSPDRWAAVPVVAHNTDFRRQQVQRLDAVRTGTVPPAFAEIDHTSAEVYRAYCQPPGPVAAASRQSTQDLIAGLTAIGDEDLLDPTRNRGWAAASFGCRSWSVASGTQPATSVTTTSPTASPAAPSPCTPRRSAGPAT
jgi:hypothetical protein